MAREIKKGVKKNQPRKSTKAAKKSRAEVIKDNFKRDIETNIKDLNKIDKLDNIEFMDDKDIIGNPWWDTYKEKRENLIKLSTERGEAYSESHSDADYDAYHETMGELDALNTEINEDVEKYKKDYKAIVEDRLSEIVDDLRKTISLNLLEVNNEIEDKNRQMRSATAAISNKHAALARLEKEGSIDTEEYEKQKGLLDRYNKKVTKLLGEIKELNAEKDSLEQVESEMGIGDIEKRIGKVKDVAEATIGDSEQVQDPVEPTEQVNELAQETAEPATPSNEPTQDTVEPVAPVNEPTQDPVEPVAPVNEPAQATVRTTESVNEPQKSAVDKKVSYSEIPISEVKLTFEGGEPAYHIIWNDGEERILNCKSKDAWSPLDDREEEFFDKSCGFDGAHKLVDMELFYTLLNKSDKEAEELEQISKNSIEDVEYEKRYFDEPDRYIEFIRAAHMGKIKEGEFPKITYDLKDLNMSTIDKKGLRNIKRIAKRESKLGIAEYVKPRSKFAILWEKYFKTPRLEAKNQQEKMPKDIAEEQESKEQKAQENMEQENSTKINPQKTFELYEQLHNEPGFNVEEFVKDMSEAEKEKYRNLQQQYGKINSRDASKKFRQELRRQAQASETQTKVAKDVQKIMEEEKTNATAQQGAHEEH